MNNKLYLARAGEGWGELSNLGYLRRVTGPFAKIIMGESGQGVQCSTTLQAYSRGSTEERKEVSGAREKLATAEPDVV